MDATAEVPRSSCCDPIVGTSRGRRANAGTLGSSLLLPAAALSASAVSLGIAAYAGWERGGTPVEQAMNIALGIMAVLYVHLSPVCWNELRVLSRSIAFAVWLVALVVVFYGQASFVLVSQAHAGNQRAATVPATAPQPIADRSVGRTLTQIAWEVAKVRADQVHVQTRCIGDCPTLKARRVALAAQLTALNFEAGEAKRRKTDDDRRNEQADRNEALRATLRADPVASQVASWVGATEPRVELMLGIACAAVLEGSAIIGWQLVSVASGRANSRESAAFGGAAVTLESEAIVSRSDIAIDDQTTVTPDHALLDRNNSSSRFVSEDDFLLEKIRQAVSEELIKPTQGSIRKFLRCGQQKAARLNRAYVARFRSA